MTLNQVSHHNTWMLDKGAVPQCEVFHGSFFPRGH